MVKPADVEKGEEYKRLTDKMVELVSNDDEVSKIVTLWRDCPDLRPREIAKLLYFTMPQMRAAQKRLQRLLKDFRDGRNE